MDRVLLVCNAYAGAVSPRRRSVIAKALSADFKLEVADTTGRDHASELAREAVDRGLDAVVGFGGDGTINEVAQGLIGTDVALGLLPGGSTNVMARIVGMPTDPVEATAVVAARLKSNSRRRIGVGRIDERHFLFAAGMGIDAEVVKRIEQNPEAKRRWGKWAFLGSALAAGATRYRGGDAALTLTADGRDPVKAMFVICCNARPFTYFGRFPVDACPRAGLDHRIDVFAIERVRLPTIARIMWSVFVSRSHPDWRTSHYHHDVDHAVVTAEDPHPVQVDGDHIGDRSQAALGYVPDALDIVV